MRVRENMCECVGMFALQPCVDAMYGYVCALVGMGMLIWTMSAEVCVC